MTCEHYEAQVSELVDGTIADARRCDVEAHLEHCPSCRDLAADLRRILSAAGALEPMAVPPRVWQRLRRQLEDEPAVAVAQPVGEIGPRASWPQSWAWLATAATLVLVTVAAVWMTRSAGAPTGVPPVDLETTVESVQADLDAAQSHYLSAIAGLEQIARTDPDLLDPAVTADLQANMTTLDAAIAESRAALASAPESESARSSLFEAFRRKVALLQYTISLMNEMRKGDEVGVGRVVSGLNES